LLVLAALAIAWPWPALLLAVLVTTGLLALLARRAQAPSLERR
jgi:hypothetical protein